MPSAELFHDSISRVIAVVLLFSSTPSLCMGQEIRSSAPRNSSSGQSQLNSDNWQENPAWLWERDFSQSPRNSTQGADHGSQGNIGTRSRVHGVFDRWRLNGSVTSGRGQDYAEITSECRGAVETRFSLDSAEWNNPSRRRQYYRDIDGLITTIGEQLLRDFNSPLSGTERTTFLRGLRAFTWQESQWQHYVRHGNRHFVFLSGGSYNALDDWGITQVARSGFSASESLNKRFFDTRGYCSISSSIYYGFMEFYTHYLKARANSCNGGDPLLQLAGAYNLYSWGASSCHSARSSRPNERNYQDRAISGFRGHFHSMPWKKEM